MASKTKKDSVVPDLPDTQEIEDTQAAGPPVAQGPPITDYVVLVNLTKGPLNCPLRNGLFVPLAPGPDPRGKHRSEKIQRKLLTPSLLLLKKKQMLGIEPASEQGGA